MNHFVDGTVDGCFLWIDQVSPCLVLFSLHLKAFGDDPLPTVAAPAVKTPEHRIRSRWCANIGKPRIRPGHLK